MKSRFISRFAPLLCAGLTVGSLQTVSGVGSAILYKPDGWSYAPFAAGNGGFLHGEAEAGYTVGGRVQDHDSALLPPDVVGNTDFSLNFPLLPLVQLPRFTSDPGKDTATISLLQTSFTVGSDAVPDRFSFALRGEASAMSSGMFDSHGVFQAADAFLSASASLTLPFDAVAKSDRNVPLGMLELDAIAPLDAFEIHKQWTVTDYFLGVPTTSTFGPGDVAAELEVLSGHVYEIRFDYDVLVPYGEDPPFTVDVGATLTSARAASAVPDGADTAMLLLPAVAILGAARRFGSMGHAYA